MSDSPSRKLTPREERFIIEYPRHGFNATKAAVAAGYSEKTASQQASRLLRKVKHIIDARQQLSLRAAGGVPEPQGPVSPIATLEQSLRLVTALAFGDPRKLFDEAGNPKTPSQLTRRQALMLQGFEIEENFTKVGNKAEHTGYTKKYTLWNRTPYVQMLMKFHNAYPPPRKSQSERDDRPGSMAWKSMPMEERLVLREKIGAVIREHLKSPKVLNGHG